MYQGTYITSKITINLSLLYGLLFIFSCTTAFADGSIHGQIRSNTTGLTIPNANIEVHNCNSIEAEKDGAYINDCPAGSYSVTITASGYQPYTSDNFILNDDDFYKLDVRLNPEHQQQNNYSQQNQTYDQMDNQDSQTQQQNYNDQNHDQKPAKSSYSKTGAILGSLLGNVASNRVDERLKKRKQPKYNQGGEGFGCVDANYDGYCDEPSTGTYNQGGQGIGCIDSDNDGYCDEPGAGTYNQGGQGYDCIDSDNDGYCDEPSTGINFEDEDCIGYDEDWNCITSDGAPSPGNNNSSSNGSSQPSIPGGRTLKPVKPIDPGTSSTGSSQPSNPGGITLKPVKPVGSANQTNTTSTQPNNTTRPSSGIPGKPGTQTSLNRTQQSTTVNQSARAQQVLTTISNINTGVTLWSGKPAVKFTLNGNNLNRITSIKAINPKGKIDNSVAITLDKRRSNNQQLIYLSAAPNAVTGKAYYRLLVFMGKNNFKIDPNKITVIVKKPAQPILQNKPRAPAPNMIRR